MKTSGRKKVAVLGFGTEGQAAYKYWSDRGDIVSIHDQNSALKLPAGAKAVLGNEYLSHLNNYDLIVRSPGIFPYRIVTTKPVTTVINEFMKRCPAKIIGVTGTKGKGTTASLIHHILKTAGKSAYLAGNIGRAPLELLPHLQPTDYVVLELSNLQLWDISTSPAIAVLLMVAPEHLDWHRGNLQEYVATKANITKFQTPADLLVFDGENSYSTQIANRSVAQKLPFYTQASPVDFSTPVGWVDSKGRILATKSPVCEASEVTLIGRHNLANVVAAIGTTLGIVKDRAVIKAAVKSYQPLPHRLEHVGQVAGVDYYDDSIATHPLAAIGAIGAFEQPKILILGGASKGQADFTPLAQVVAEANIRGVITIGSTARVINKALKNSGYSKPLKTGLQSMAAIIATAAGLAQPGDVVLLSPACASFGLFKDYADRGQQFQYAIQSLKET